jgi:hypothetical protein
MSMPKLQGRLCNCYRALIALAFELIAMPAVAAPQPLVIANPGFEGNYAPVSECANITGEVAAGCTDNTCWDATQPLINYTRDGANPHGGAAAQKITLVRAIHGLFQPCGYCANGLDAIYISRRNRQRPALTVTDNAANPQALKFGRTGCERSRRVTAARANNGKFRTNLTLSIFIAAHR